MCYAQPPELLERSLKDKPSQRYLVQLPSGYKQDIKYPLFITIHWYTGTAQQQINEWKFYANKDEYILLCPQFSDGYQWFEGREDETLIEIINEAKEDFYIDPGRVFLVGNSGGGQFVHRFAFKHPEHIKAACVLSAGDYEAPPDLSDAKSVKYYVAVGEDDERLGITRRFYLQLRDKGYSVVYKSFPMVGHVLHSSMKREVMDFLRELNG